MALREAIETALENAGPTPPNEAATLLRIIDPLLQAMGYSLLEIDPEAPVSQWQRPDRILLPGTEHEWYLEAKAWGVSLDDEKHLQQATSYAHSQGRRWVVLTNGQIWRIYDDHIPGLPPKERLVAEARLDQLADMEQFLRAISKKTVVSGGLGQFALRTRLSAILTRSLKDEHSPAIGSLCSVIRKEPGMGNVSRHDVAAYFLDLQAAVQPERKPEPIPVVVPPKPKAADTSGAHQEPDLDTLALKARELATGAKPVAVTFPDGSTIGVASWRDLACEILDRLGQDGKVPPVPFKGSAKGHRYFLNTSPDHASGLMMEAFRKLSLAGSDVYVDLHRSAADILARLREVCAAVSVPAASLKVRLVRGSDADASVTVPT